MQILKARNSRNARFAIAPVLLRLVCSAICCAATLLGVLPDFARAQTAESSIQPARLAYGADLKKDGSNWKLTVRFDGKPDSRVFLMESPARLIFEVSNAVLRLGDDAALDGHGLVKSHRYGIVSADKSRLVLTLAQPAGVIEKKLLQDKDNGRFSVEVTINPLSQKEFSETIEVQEALLGTSGDIVVKGARVRAGPRKAGTFSIVIDPGHGGIDGGSRGGKLGILEKEVTLAMAKRLGKMIENAGPFEVSYTRTEDVFISLKERQRFAQRQGADLLISIHADSLREEHVRGATIYTLAKKATDALSQQIADSENLADVVAGLAAPDAQDDVTDILADLTLRETTRFSHRFSTLLVERMQNDILMIRNPQRAAAFAVLKNAEVPGVLVEMGYLSNHEDEKLLVNESWQQKVSEIITAAVSDFFSVRQTVSGQN